MTETEIDMEKLKKEMKKDYRDATGEELPAHVVDNYRLLNASGPTFEDLDDAFERGSMAPQRGAGGEVKEHTTSELAGWILGTAVVLGGLGYGSGVALAGQFGTAVVALVSAAFGFAIGVVLRG